MKKLLLPLLVSVLFVNMLSGQTALENIIKQKLDLYNSILPFEKVYVQCDRPFYRPGDDIWMGLWVTDGVTNKPSGVSEIVNVELIDPQGSTIEARRVLSHEGRATCDFTIDSASSGGIYKVKAYTSWMQNFSESDYFVREIQVQEVSLPVVRMKLDYEREAYGPGDKVSAKLRLQNSDNSPLSEYPFTYYVSLNGESYIDSFGETDKEGRAVVSFILPPELTLKDGMLTVRAEVKGDVVTISRSVPIILDNIDLWFFPEGGDLITGVDNNCAFKALNEYGKPADVEGVVFNKRHQEVARFRSYHHGMGSFHFVPQAGEKYYALIDKPEGIMKLYPLPISSEGGYMMELPSPMLFTRPGSDNKAPVRIVSPDNTTVTLVAQVQGRVIYSAAIPVSKGENMVSVPLAGFPCGVAQLTLFTGDNVEVCERLVFVNKGRQLRVSITPDRESYQPRDKVSLQISTTDLKGNPVAASMALAVVDDKLISLADDRSDNILSYLLLSSEVKGKIEEPSFYFDPAESRADTALDYLLLTQGWRRFTWEEVVGTSSTDLAARVHYKPEKRMLCGTIYSRSKAEIQRTRLYIEETGQQAIPDHNGYYEFHGLDLTNPVTLVAVTGSNDTIRRIISDYSSADTYKYLYYQSRSGDGVSGVVREEGTGNPIPGATVCIKGTTRGTVTDLEGRFFIDASRNDILRISFIGDRTKEVTVGKEKNIVVELPHDFIEMEEVVVVAYEVRRMRSVVYSSVVETQHTRNPVRLDAVQDNTGKQTVNRPLVPPVEEKRSAAQVERLSAGDEIIYIDDDTEVELEEDNDIFVIVEEMPQFPGGDEQVLRYISSNLRYPEIAVENAIQGKVVVRFIVNREGRVVDPVVIRGVDPLLDNEALRIIRSMPRWTPARQMGKPVDVYYTIPISFVLKENDSNGGYAGPYRSEPEKPRYYRARQFYMPVYDNSDEVTQRNDFRRTIYWNPLLQTDATGKATVWFYCSDAITTFRATAEGIGVNGAAGRAEKTFFSSRPLSVDALIPGKVSFGDTIFIPVTLSNTSSEPVNAQVSFEYPSFLQPLGDELREVTIPAGDGITCLPGFIVRNTRDSGTIRISIDAGSYSDAISSPVVSEPYGYQKSVSYSSGDLHSMFEVLTTDALPGSLKADVQIFPGLQSSLTSGVESMLREPHGCFEQASAIVYPEILAIRYLRASGQSDAETERRALDYISRGYKLLTSYETPTGGFEWFGKSPGHEGLTAMGLMLFNDMRTVTDVLNDGMYKRTLYWLLSRRDGKGGFLVEEGKYGFSNNAYLLNNAYIVYALSETGNRDIYREFEKSYNDNINRGDAYCMALLANSAFNLGDTAKANALISRLGLQAGEKGVASLRAETSVTGSRGKSLSVETASLLAMALVRQQQRNEVLLSSCMSFILSARERNSFGSTQANILALKALTAFYKIHPELLSKGTAEVKVNGITQFSEPYSSANSRPLATGELQKSMREGANTISIDFSETVLPVDFRLNVEYYSLTPPEQFSTPVSVTTELKQTSVRRGESIRITCRVKNEEDIAQSMAVAAVILPEGFAFQPWQLKELQEKGVYDFYEIRGNTLYLYYRSLAPAAEYAVNLDVMALIPGTYHSFTTECWLYYMPEAKSYSRLRTLEIVQ